LHLASCNYINSAANSALKKHKINTAKKLAKKKAEITTRKELASQATQALSSEVLPDDQDGDVNMDEVSLQIMSKVLI
jgi:hypothetical protein